MLWECAVAKKTMENIGLREPKQKMPNHKKHHSIPNQPSTLFQPKPRLPENDLKYRDGKINVCHHIKGHIPLLVYNSFKPYQFNISLPKFLVVTATS